MKYIIKRTLLVVLTSIVIVSCHSIRKKELMSDMDIRISLSNLYKCNQFYFTDSNLYVLFYNFNSSKAYNPFAMNPYVICYDRDFTFLDIEQLYTTKIVQEKSDTIYVIGLEQNTKRKRHQKKIRDKSIKYVTVPSQTRNICNKAIKSFQLDTLTMCVNVKYREYPDPTIGITNPLFFHDSTLFCAEKDSIYKLSDFIFHSIRDDNQCDSNNQISSLYFSPDQTIHEVLLFENPKILRDFYEELNKYIDHIQKKRNTTDIKIR